jgi:hypothetical protein
MDRSKPAADEDRIRRRRSIRCWLVVVVVMGGTGTVVDCELVEVSAWDVDDDVESEVDEVDDEIERTEDGLTSARLTCTGGNVSMKRDASAAIADTVRALTSTLVVLLDGSTQTLTGPSAT